MLVLEVQDVVSVNIVLTKRDDHDQVHVRSVAGVEDVIETAIRCAIDDRGRRVREKF